MTAGPRECHARRGLRTPVEAARADDRTRGAIAEA